MDTIVLQVAQLYGINVNSTRDLLPAIFMKAFTDVTVRILFCFCSFYLCLNVSVFL